MSEKTIEDSLPDRAALLAGLIDLLQLEYDALPTYTVAIAGVQRQDFQAALRRFREDHGRHVRELASEIRGMGGIPLTLPHLPTGLLKLGLQMVGLPGGDRAVLLAFAANEWQSQEKYARYAAAPYPRRIHALLQRNAEDEARHYAWACAALEELGCGEDTTLGQAHRAFTRFHGGAADAIEALGRMSMETAVRSIRAA